MVKTASDVLHVVGVINYCNSAFEWPTHTASTEYSTLLDSLNSISRQPARQIAALWNATFPDVRDRLFALMANRPWAYCDPKSIISDDSCLIMTTDASDTAVAVSLFRVKKSDAKAVTKSDLLNRDTSQLIGVVYKKLSGSQTSWHTFESELFAIVLGCKKFGSFITTATVNYPPGGVSKIGIWSDSTTALGQWRTISLPTNVEEHLSAKARRFSGWADKVAYTRYWPLHTAHLPGAQNDISHILSHLGDQARRRQNFLDATGAGMLACPGTLHTFHDDPAPTDPLSGLDVLHLALGPSDVSEIQRAYLNDHTLIHSVPLSDIYKVLTKHAEAASVPVIHQTRIREWDNKRFFSVPSPHGSGCLLFAPSSATVNKYPDDSDNAVDLTRHLVTVVPCGADVRVTTVDPISGPGSGHHYDDHDMRRDVLIHCHDNSHHPSLLTTHTSVRSLVWFANMQ